MKNGEVLLASPFGRCFWGNTWDKLKPSIYCVANNTSMPLRIRSRFIETHPDFIGTLAVSAHPEPDEGHELSMTFYLDLTPSIPLSARREGKDELTSLRGVPLHCLFDPDSSGEWISYKSEMDDEAIPAIQHNYPATDSSFVPHEFRMTVCLLSLRSPDLSGWSNHYNAS